MKKTIVSLLFISALFACKKEDKDISEQTFTGPKQQFHNGKAWSWMRMTKSGRPLQVGIRIDDAASLSVPTEAMDGDGGHHSNENSIVLPLHPKAMELTPFKTIGVDWNPAGHPPENIYTKPHFDFHFYLMTEAERLAATDPAKLNAVPLADYLPPTYFGVDPVPQMGKHWLDMTSPELNPANPAPFTQTFVYGSYNSKVNFYEPMITLGFLKNTAQFERSIPQPTKFASVGYYPTKMKVVKHDGVTDIILEGFVLQQGS
jgi:hypothetical protein